MENYFYNAPDEETLMEMRAEYLSQLAGDEDSDYQELNEDNCDNE